MENLFTEQNLVALALSAGAIQAIIGMIRKNVNMDRKGMGELVLAVAVLIVFLMQFAIYEFGDTVYFKWLVESIMAVLAAAGFWRYRNGEATSWTFGEIINTDDVVEGEEAPAE